jgi:hypothetical protein
MTGSDLRMSLGNELTEMLLVFIERNITWTVKQDPTYAAAAFCELRRLLSCLVDAGYPLEKLLNELDHGLDRLMQTDRSQLVRAYVRSSDFAEVIEIGETLGQCIAYDRTWNWQADFDQAVEELEQGRRDARAFA